MLGAVLVLGACASGGDSNDKSGMGMDAPGAAQAPAAPSAAGDAGKAGPGSATARPNASAAPSGPAPQNPAVADRKLILTADVRLEADSPESAAASARAMAIGMGGMVSGEQTQRSQLPPGPDGPDGKPAPPRFTITSSLTLKVPPAQFDRALDQLSALGQVVARNRTATDVTEQVVDVASRIETQRRSVERVRELLARAVSISEIVSLESEVTRREAELDSLLKRQQTLTSQVDLATIAVVLTSPPIAESPGITEEKDKKDGESFGGAVLDALRGGWEAFCATTRVVLVVAAAVLPFAVVAVLLWLLLRRFDNPLSRALADRSRRRREAHAYQPWTAPGSGAARRADDEEGHGEGEETDPEEAYESSRP